MLVRVKGSENFAVGGKAIMYLFTYLRNRSNANLKHILGEKTHEHFQVYEEFGVRHNSKKSKSATLIPASVRQYSPLCVLPEVVHEQSNIHL